MSAKTKEAVVKTAMHQIAEYVGITGDQMRRLIGVMKMADLQISHAQSTKPKGRR